MIVYCMLKNEGRQKANGNKERGKVIPLNVELQESLK